MRPGKGHAMSPDRTSFVPSTYALLRALSVAPYGLIPRMHLCTIVDLECDVGINQWAVSVPFDYLFDVWFGFL